MPSPIILTLQLDEESQAHFQRARERWFPPSLDQVPAHLTLLHKLPGEERDTVIEKTATICAARTAFPVTVASVIGLGKGVAYRLDAPALDALHADLVAAFKPWLTPQDKQRFRAHVTVQNKVSPATAKACLGVLESGFSPFVARAEAVQLWTYEGGPWGTLGAIAFGREMP